MKITEAEFTGSFTDRGNCPPVGFPEFAFIGRSNVGKSSLINMLCNRKNLARTSSTPGKTLQINFILINRNIYFVDLPGYGYSRIPKKDRLRIAGITKDYLKKRPGLTHVFLLIDIRLPQIESDRRFMEWMASEGIPFSIVFTKADKLSQTQQKNHVEEYKRELIKQWEELPPIFITSAKNKAGKEDLLSYIEEMSLMPKRNCS